MIDKIFKQFNSCLIYSDTDICYMYFTKEEIDEIHNSFGTLSNILEFGGKTWILNEIEDEIRANQGKVEGDNL